MRVAKWMDGNEAPVPHLNLAQLGFTKVFILSRLSSTEDLDNFLEYLKPRLNGKQIENMPKRKLQKAVSEYLLEKPRKPSTGVVTTQQKESASAEDNFLKRFEKLQDDVLILVGLMKENPGEYGSFATDLREFVIQHLPLEDDVDD